MAAGELWIGRGEVKPLAGADAQIADATWASATVIAFASSAEEFLERFDEGLAASNLGLVKFDGATPAHEWFDVDEEFFAAFVEAAQSGEPVLWVINTDEPLDADDPDSALLREASGTGEPVQFRLIGSDSWLLGYAVATSEEWTVLHVVDTATAAFDGHLIVRLDEVIDTELVDTDAHFVFRVLDSRGELARDPEIPLADLPAMLRALSERHPLVSLGEEESAGVAVGKIVDVGKDRVTLAGVNTAGAPTDDFAHTYAKIRSIGFGTTYLEALASVMS